MTETKIKATDNLAKDVEQPKTRLIPVPPQARTEIIRLGQLLDNYIAGTVAGMGITGQWGFDMKTKQVIVQEQ